VHEDVESRPVVGAALGSQRLAFDLPRKPILTLDSENAKVCLKFIDVNVKSIDIQLTQACVNHFDIF
jgi:hypothetical protein